MTESAAFKRVLIRVVDVDDAIPSFDDAVAAGYGVVRVISRLGGKVTGLCDVDARSGEPISTADLSPLAAPEARGSLATGRVTRW